MALLGQAKLTEKHFPQTNNKKFETVISHTKCDIEVGAPPKLNGQRPIFVRLPLWWTQTELIQIRNNTEITFPDILIFKSGNLIWIQPIGNNLILRLLFQKLDLSLADPESPIWNTITTSPKLTYWGYKTNWKGGIMFYWDLLSESGIWKKLGVSSFSYHISRFQKQVPDFII